MRRDIAAREFDVHEKRMAVVFAASLAAITGPVKRQSGGESHRGLWIRDDYLLNIRGAGKAMMWVVPHFNAPVLPPAGRRTDL